jgi:hypothetical protein
MKISNYAPYAEERFETARQHPILHPERIIGNSELSRNGFEEVGRISTGKSQSHLRGLKKVQMEMLWACLTYNLQHWIRLSKRNTTPAVT